ncbi:netrin receptor UNC5B-like [Ptychodera flava]|uniref:netrin receptor UNC5B-like n=1 Tax=Ptychodera flava TaxID=63121 RepID=UPI00396A1E5D
MENLEIPGPKMSDQNSAKECTTENNKGMEGGSYMTMWKESAFKGIGFLKRLAKTLLFKDIIKLEWPRYAIGWKKDEDTFPKDDDEALQVQESKQLEQEKTTSLDPRLELKRTDKLCLTKVNATAIPKCVDFEETESSPKQDSMVNKQTTAKKSSPRRERRHRLRRSTSASYPEERSDLSDNSDFEAGDGNNEEENVKSKADRSRYNGNIAGSGRRKDRSKSKSASGTTKRRVKSSPNLAAMAMHADDEKVLSRTERCPLVVDTALGYGNTCFPKLITSPAIPSTVAPKHFVSGIFDENGGHLVLPCMEVNLFIPPGALPRGKTQQIFLYVSLEDRHQPTCSRSESQVGPAIICGPNGLTFQEDVCLTFRHWMTESHEGVQVSPVFSATDLDQPCDYQPLVDPSVPQECQAAMCLFNDKNNTCTILVDHFTGYSLKSKSSESHGDSQRATQSNPDRQWICVIPYIALQTDIQIRVYVRKNSPQVERDVAEAEKTLGTPGEKCSPTKRFPLLLNQQDVSVSVANVEDGWCLHQEHLREQKLHYDCLCDIGEDVCDFTFKKRESKSCAESASSSTFRCSIILVQLQNGNSKVEFSVTQDLDKGSPCWIPTVRKASLSVDTRHNISAYLDPEHPLGNDWKKFADWFGHSANIYIDIGKLEYEWVTKVKSPTQKLLSVWESLNLTAGADGSLCELRKFFKSIKRDDVLQELPNHECDECVGNFYESGYESSSQPGTPEMKRKYNHTTVVVK